MGKPKGNRRIERKRGDDGGTGMGRDIAAVLLTALGLAAGIALVTFSALDGRLVSHGLPPASNLMGPVGHHAARLLYRVLGFASLVIPVALCAAALRLFRAQPLRLTLLGSAAYGVLTLSLATLCDLFLASRHLASFPAGGRVGHFFSLRAEALFSTVGSALVVGACALVALIVATDFKVQEAAVSLARAARAIAGFAAARLTEALERHRRAVAELRAEEADERRRRPPPAPIRRWRRAPRRAARRSGPPGRRRGSWRDGESQGRDRRGSPAIASARRRRPSRAG